MYRFDLDLDALDLVAVLVVLSYMGLNHLIDTLCEIESAACAALLSHEAFDSCLTT